ncbi:hypothetical protein [Paraburkholderia tagetis]|uniref:Uncharacterized protein n=1 Tax=Paraburkholderia tagetis TaxID=2913261 RepID=A0A9X1RWE7_9BURK|nr:hypothetical protein [Paraburkholderia tagetis]MCG5077277.1 hypothetical protein [Paraburkholderia tagetis]
MNVPASRVYNARSIAKMPEALADLFGREKIAPRLARTLEHLLNFAGEAQLMDRAALVPEHSSVDDKLTVLAYGTLPQRSDAVQVKLVNEGTAIQIEAHTLELLLLRPYLELFLKPPSIKS